MQLHTASSTAKIAALARFGHCMEPQQCRVLSDPFAKEFLSPWLRPLFRSRTIRRLVIRYFEHKLPGAYGEVGARTAYIDDYVRQSVVRGVRQVVLLGAGYDCRAYRMPELARIRVFEVDHPATQRAKREILNRILSSPPGNVSFVGVDFLRDRLSDKLLAQGYSHDIGTVFVWEAVCRYLTPESVDDTLAFVASNSGHPTSIVFDYVYRSLLDSPDPSARKWVRYFEKQKEPYIFAMEKGMAADFLHERGFYRVHEVDSEYMEQQYFIPRDVSVRVSPFFGWVTAEVSTRVTT